MTNTEVMNGVDYFNHYFSKDSIESIYLEKIRNRSGKGVDGVDSQSFDEDLASNVERIHRKVSMENFRFSPYLEVVKSKGRGKSPRIISKPTIRDNVVLAATKEYLHNKFPSDVPNKLPNTYINEIKEFISSESSEDHCYIKIDIQGFYDNINPAILLDNLSTDISKEPLTIIRRAIKNKTVPKAYRKSNSDLYKPTAGVPQGLSISNILASIYMREIDSYMSGVCDKYFRYVDDILFFCKKEDAPNIEAALYSKLKDIGLSSHEDGDSEKVEKGFFSKPFEYLGYQISTASVTVRTSTKTRFIESMIAMFTSFKHRAVRTKKKSKHLHMKDVKDIFTLTLNERITGVVANNKRYGWLFYFSEMTDISLLHLMDNIIQEQFKRLDLFDNKTPNDLKSFVRSYYEAKYSTFSGYIPNYDKHSTTEDKLSYLVKFGYIPHYDGKAYTADEIDRIYAVKKAAHLLKLEEDVGNIS